MSEYRIPASINRGPCVFELVMDDVAMPIAPAGLAVHCTSEDDLESIIAASVKSINLQKPVTVHLETFDFIAYPSIIVYNTLKYPS